MLSDIIFIAGIGILYLYAILAAWIVFSEEKPPEKKLIQLIE